MTVNRSVINAIRSASNQDLDQMIEALKQRRNELTKEKARAFRIGDAVQFDAKTRGVIEGEIIKINRKTVQVKAFKGLGTTWRVSPSLLKKV